MIPPPTLTITPIDTRALSEKLGRMAEVFYKRGASPTMLQQFVVTEAGQWAGDAADILGPQTLAIGTAKLYKEVKGQLTTVPTWLKFTESQQRSTYGNFTWLQAGPNFLLGIDDEDNQPGADPAAGLAYYRAGQGKSGSRGRAHARLGTVERTGQAIWRANRVRVSQTTFSGVLTLLRLGFGKARASFASTTLALGLKRRFPAFVLRHIETVRADGRAVLDEGGLVGNPACPSLVFGSQAPGVESNPKMVAALQEAADVRAKIAEWKLKKLIRGAVYNINTGQVYREDEPGEGEI